MRIPSHPLPAVARAHGLRGPRRESVTAALPLTGRVPVVTGGAMGIGRALAPGLAESGAIVAVVDRPEAHARSQ